MHLIQSHPSEGQRFSIASCHSWPQIAVAQVPKVATTRNNAEIVENLIGAAMARDTTAEKGEDDRKRASQCCASRAILMICMLVVAAE